MNQPGKAAILALTALLGAPSFADNPIVQTSYTADPAPMVWQDTVYVYTSHDEDVTLNNFFTMNDWRVYSTTDMVNWTDRGSPLSHKTFSWSPGKAWAAQCVPRNGKFYWYATAGIGSGQQPTIAVAVADHPAGPYKDAIGKPLVNKSWDDIDPTAFVDTDGQAYLFWGNPKLYWAKLNSDMTSLNGAVNTTNMTTAAFGTRPNATDRPTTYEEGPWFFRRGNLYYMVYAAGPLPEPIHYSTSSSPTGPWTFKGTIMSGANTGSFTNHSGIIEFKGRAYFFYHTGKLPGGGGYKRSTAVEEFKFNSDGTIPTISMTNAGPAPVDSLDPYRRVEGETMAWSQGLKTAQSTQTGMYLTMVHNNDHVKLRSVDFGNAGAKSFTASVASAGAGGTIELRVGSTSGRLLGTLTVSGTGGATTWKEMTTNVTGATGVQDLYLVFKGSGSGELFNLDHWKFNSNTTGVSPRGAIASRTTSDLVDVRDLTGSLVRSQVARGSATSGLRPGVYLVEGRPVAIPATR